MLHVHWGLDQLSPLLTSDGKWVVAKHCGRAKRSRISDTPRLRLSLQFRYINNQSFHIRPVNRHTVPYCVHVNRKFRCICKTILLPLKVWKNMECVSRIVQLSRRTRVRWLARATVETSIKFTNTNQTRPFPAILIFHFFIQQRKNTNSSCLTPSE